MVRALHWRIENRFDDYVRHQTGDGQVALDGVSVDAHGQYVFPAISNEDAPPGTLCFSGSVEYTAYLGVLTLRIAQPQVMFTADEARLFVRGARPYDEPSILAVAGTENHAATPLMFRLTDLGSEIFFGKYPPGWPLAPAQIQYRKHQEAIP